MLGRRSGRLLVVLQQSTASQALPSLTDAVGVGLDDAPDAAEEVHLQTEGPGGRHVRRAGSSGQGVHSCVARGREAGVSAGATATQPRSRRNSPNRRPSTVQNEAAHGAHLKPSAPWRA